jgi:pimeloyl-ACP methyl ester carboxylesterase
LCSRLLFLYSALFPEKVDIAIGFDNLKPLTMETAQEVASIKFTLDGISIINERSQESNENPPAYTVEEMIERLHVGSNESVTRECAPYLLKRNIQPSRKYPGKFSFSRDGRLKYSTFPYYSHDVCMHMARRITMPYLFITASGTPEFEKSHYTTEVLEILLKNPRFEYHMIDSTSHHFHLVEPEKIADTVGSFIRKHRGGRAAHHL